MKKTLFILSIICLVGTTQSCKKKGCTNSNATNYNSKAKKDDGSCVLPVVVPPQNNSGEISINSEPLYYFKIEGNEQDSREKQNVVQYNYDGSNYIESQFKYGSNPSQIGIVISRRGMTAPSTLTNTEIEAYFTPGIYDLNDFQIRSIKDNGQSFSTLYSSLDQSNSQVKIVASQSEVVNGQFFVKVYIEFNCNTGPISGNWTEKFVTEGKIVTYFKV